MTVTVITGGSAGLGRATALAFAKAGHRTGLIARDPAGLAETKREIETAGADCAVFAADVADAAAVEAAAIHFERELGPIEVWVNNAMVTVFGRVDEIGADEFRRATEVTYLGYVHGTLTALKRMKRRGRGIIVQVGSALAYRAIPLQAPYCASEFAIRGFTDALRCELMHDKSPVKLTMVHMPALNTPQFDWARTHFSRAPRPVGTIFSPETGARAILQAVRDPSRETWVGGSTILAILGQRLWPRYMDRRMARDAFDAQLDGELPGPQIGNLFAPAVGFHRTAGRFTVAAKQGAVTVAEELWPVTLVGLLVLAIFVMVLVLIV